MSELKSTKNVRFIIKVNRCSSENLGTGKCKANAKQQHIKCCSIRMKLHWIDAECDCEHEHPKFNLYSFSCGTAIEGWTAIHQITNDY